MSDEKRLIKFERLDEKSQVCPVGREPVIALRSVRETVAAQIRRQGFETVCCQHGGHFFPDACVRSQTVQQDDRTAVSAWPTFIMDSEPV